jgi:hypothetical protein
MDSRCDYGREKNRADNDGDKDIGQNRSLETSSLEHEERRLCLMLQVPYRRPKLDATRSSESMCWIAWSMAISRALRPHSVGRRWWPWPIDVGTWTENK